MDNIYGDITVRVPVLSVNSPSSDCRAVGSHTHKVKILTLVCVVVRVRPYPTLAYDKDVSNHKKLISSLGYGCMCACFCVCVRACVCAAT